MTYHDWRSVENVNDFVLAKVITGTPSLVSTTFITVSVPRER